MPSNNDGNSLVYNDNAQVYESQFVIRDTTFASITGGALIVQGGVSSKDLYATGHVAVNNVFVTPNLNDIIYEQQATLNPQQYEYIDIPGFCFDNSITNSFTASINVTVSTAAAKYALWEINGVYRNGGWVTNSRFTGDLTGVRFRVVNSANKGQLQYVNSNSNEGGDTVIRYRASTTAPAGTSPLTSAGIVLNTSGPYVVGSLLYSNTPTNMASANEIKYLSNTLSIAGASRFQAESQAKFTSFSNGGAITSMGDVSIAQDLIVGGNFGVNNTAPAYAMDVNGDINVTGNLFNNNVLVNFEQIWTKNANTITTTLGNVGIGTTSPSASLEVAGDIASHSVTAGTGTFTHVVCTNSTISSLACSNSTVTNLSAGNLNSNNMAASSITGGSLSLSGDLQVAGTLVVQNITSTNLLDTNVTAGTILSNVAFAAIGNSNTLGNIFTSGGNVGIGTDVPSCRLDVVGSTRTDNLIATNVTAANVQASNVSMTSLTSGTMVAQNITSGGVFGSNGNFSNLTAGNIVSTRITATNGNFLGLTAANMLANAITTSSVVATHGIFSNMTAANCVATRLTSGGVFTTTLTATTGITGGNMFATNGNFLNLSAGSLVATSITSSGLNVTNAKITNLTASNVLWTRVTQSNVLSVSNGNFVNVTGTNGNFVNLTTQNLYATNQAVIRYPFVTTTTKVAINTTGGRSLTGDDVLNGLIVRTGLNNNNQTDNLPSATSLETAIAAITMATVGTAIDCYYYNASSNTVSIAAGSGGNLTGPASLNAPGAASSIQLNANTLHQIRFLLLGNGTYSAMCSP